MINFNTARRAICTLAVASAFIGTALADSVLNFTPANKAGIQTGISVTNTTASTADVKFTLYSENGAVVSTPGLTNPISHRVAPGNQLAMLTWEIFGAKPGVPTDGWIQATSSVNGLQGFYFSGDFTNSFDGAEASTPYAQQTIPYIMPGQTTIIVTNPSGQAVDIIASFYDNSGAIVHPGQAPYAIKPHGQVSFKGDGNTVRVATQAAGAAVLVTAVEGYGPELALINGKPADAGVGQWVVPYFKYGESVMSALVLANLASSGQAQVTINFFNNAGGLVKSKSGVKIPLNGSYTATWGDLVGEGGLNPPMGDGWLLVDSNAPLAGAVFVTNGSSITAIPLQSSGNTQTLLSRVVTKDLTSRLNLVGDAEKDAEVRITLSRPDGTTAVQSDLISLRARSRLSGAISNFVSATGFESGFVTIRSSVPIYSVELMDLQNGRAQSVVTPQRSLALVLPTQTAAAPVITKVQGEAQPNAKLQIEAQNVTSDSVLIVGSSVIDLKKNLNGELLPVTLPPALETGPVSLKIRSAGGESNPWLLGDYVAPNGPLAGNSQSINGRAFFQKVEVTDNGLETSLTYNMPIRYAKVEVQDGQTGQTLSYSETDEDGRFRIVVPKFSNLNVRVYSQLRSVDLKVLNNAVAGAPVYFIPKTIDGADSSDIELIDTTRSAGAFNILDVLTKANSLLIGSAPGFVPPPLTVYWAASNDGAALAKLTGGAIRTTSFISTTNAAYILGDRSTDSDEYDDSVILHEYAHMLAARFSRDDSNGGVHFMGDSLDPRIAWSEGWANFFSAAVRGSSVYRDSKAGNTVLRFDIEDNVPTGDHPGYSSEATVGGVLWDLMDDNADNADLAQFPFSAIWNAFTDLKNDRNVYLPLFLEHFLQRNPGVSDTLRTMVIARTIDFQPDVRPSVTNPFPFSIAVGEFKNGQVDSFTTKRTNLSTSAHFYSLTTAASGVVSIKLFITGLGGGNNLNANDLDLFLYDSTGKKVIAQSDAGGNAAGELITVVLPAGSYFVEIRSFYNRLETNSTVFNSGAYRLTVDPIR